MSTNKIRKIQGFAAGVAALSLLLAACSKAPAPADTPAASEAPASETPAPAPSTETPPPNAAEPSPSPAPTPPPPTEPSAAPKPTAAANDPALESMQRATPGAKMSVAVDLHYSFDADPATHSAVTLHLAAVPRVAGTGLHVSIKQTAGIALKGDDLKVQKASAAGIYRQQYAVTRSAAGADKLRVLVTMDMPEGKAFGYFTIPMGTIPLASGNPSQKLESVKQR